MFGWVRATLVQRGGVLVPGVLVQLLSNVDIVEAEAVLVQQLVFVLTVCGREDRSRSSIQCTIPLLLRGKNDVE